jgi:molybdenum cofactor cytidylyltransferase
MSVTGLLLAAGASRRFGAADKLLAPLHGKPLVTHAASALRDAGCDRLVAVAGGEAVAALLPGFLVVPPDPAAPGQAGSLRAGVAVARAQGADHLLLLLGDMPFVTPGLLESVLAAGLETGSACATNGTVRMPPAVFSTAQFPALAAVTGDKGARALLNEIPKQACIPALPESLADIDTPRDLAHANTPGACKRGRGV